MLCLQNLKYLIKTHRDLFCQTDPYETGLLLTEPPLNPSFIQNSFDEIVFEEYGFNLYQRMPGANACSYTLMHADCCLIVDSGVLLFLL